jgi:FkbM family methyltransferase
MKQSLRKAIALFNFSERLSIYTGLFFNKLNLKKSAKATALLQICDKYVRFIEQGVHFSRKKNNHIKASVGINQKLVSVYLRKNSSDLQVFESVIILEEYKIAVAKTNKQERRAEKIIVDAGGNIGLTTIYLHAFFPGARFFIIEPDANNFSLLKMNLEENKITSATLYKKALWVNQEKLVINNSFRDGKDWSLTVEKANTDVDREGIDFIEGITLQEICTAASIETIDLLKIDIEGAERFLFTNASFLQSVSNLVSNLVIEIHDEFNIRETINEKMLQSGFVQTDVGEITLYSKN